MLKDEHSFSVFNIKAFERGGWEREKGRRKGGTDQGERKRENNWVVNSYTFSHSYTHRSNVMLRACPSWTSTYKPQGNNSKPEWKACVSSTAVNNVEDLYDLLEVMYILLECLISLQVFPSELSFSKRQILWKWQEERLHFPTHSFSPTKKYPNYANRDTV